ncbi:MAG: tetratricopeptide repeat protein [Planctomycetia bacterium]|nr:tetratricopeptide repeat protein [Planctomycetia bacterium]
MRYCRFWISCLGLSVVFSLQTFCLAEKTTSEGEFEEECALFLEAMNFYHGNGVERNIPKAVELFEQAALEEHHVNSMKMLVRIYSLGEGVEVDEEKILKFLQMAAGAGDADSQFTMGMVLIASKNPEQKKDSVVWFERAAEQNHPEAQRTLGIFCSTGKYLPKNDEKAVFWFQKAADLNDAMAQLALGMALRDGVGTPKNEKLAFSYLLKSAKRGLAEAQYNVAVCYINGTGVKRDTRKAVPWLRKSADQGFAQAIQLLEKVGIPHSSL